MKFSRSELAGAVGDLGTFIPLFVGMVTLSGLQVVPTLITTGVMNIVTGFVFRIPMPVQPMKAIATVAIGERLTEVQILEAGIATGAVILILGVTGFIDAINRIVPKSVVRGLQLAIGLKLAIKGIEMISDRPLLGWDSLAVGVLCAAVALWLLPSRKAPAALVLFVLGLVALVASVAVEPHSTRGALGFVDLGVRWRLPNLSRWADWREAVLRAALPQIPLTTLNSVVSVCALSQDLFPDRSAAPKRVAISVGLMNLIGCPLGGMPACHGAGGLAAQHRFGARTGGAVVALGIAKIGLALLFGDAVLHLLQAYPHSVLGVLLAFGGLELAMVCRDQTSSRHFWHVLVTAGTCLAVHTAAGFAIGMVVAYVQRDK